MQRLARFYHQLQSKGEHVHKKKDQTRRAEKEKDAKKTKDREAQRSAGHYSVASDDSHHGRARTTKKRKARSAE